MPRKSKLSSNSLATVSKPRKTNTPPPSKVAPSPSFAKDSPGDILVQVGRLWRKISLRLKPQGPPRIVPEEQSVLEERRLMYLAELRLMQVNDTITRNVITQEFVPRGIAARDVWKALAQLDETHAKGIESLQRMNDAQRRLIKEDRQNWECMNQSMESLRLTPLPEKLRAQLDNVYIDNIQALLAGLKKVSEVDTILKNARAMHSSKKSPRVKEARRQLMQLLMQARPPYSRKSAAKVLHRLLSAWNSRFAGTPDSLRVGSRP